MKKRLFGHASNRQSLIWQRFKLFSEIRPAMSRRSENRGFSPSLTLKPVDRPTIFPISTAANLICVPVTSIVVDAVQQNVECAIGRVELLKANFLNSTARNVRFYRLS